MKLISVETYFKQKLKNITRAKLVCEKAPKSSFGSPAVYQDLSSRHDWPVEMAIARLANQVEGQFLACSKRSVGSVVRTPVSANPGFNFTPGFLIFLSKALSRIIFSFLFRVSNHQIVGKEN